MLPSTLPAQMIAWALLLAWLAICVIFDLRSRQVPAFLTVLPLILAATMAVIPGWLAACGSGGAPGFDI
ncbi:MAG: hypothetical protein KatS3mg045_0948 [Bellilinea sp.]|nr:MAG: hypothetical protein KatS3mg045_0948 [Bellilinea sp.]